MQSTNLDYGTGKDGAPNALFDGLARVVASFPTDRTHDTRRGSPSTPETILANAKLFAAAPELLALAKHIESMADDAYLTGHPEFVEIAREAKEALKATS